jgi:hypothetical protein
MTQTHIIKKQILDITLDSETGSFAFQNRIGEIYKAEIIPVIDAYCTGISDGSEIVRIDTLEIDLGTMQRGAFAREFKNKIEELFPVKLEEALERNQYAYISGVSGDDSGLGASVTPETRDVEVLEFFIKYGRLPWWVRAGEVYDIPSVLARYVSKQPVRIKNLIAGLNGKPDPVKRLVYYAGEPVLAEIITLFGQDNQTLHQFSGDLITIFSGCPLLTAYDPVKIRTEVWAGILSLAAVSREQSLNRKDMIGNLAGQIAATFGVDYSALYHDIVKEVENRSYDIDVQPGSRGITEKTIKQYAERLENITKILQEFQTGLMAPGITADVASTLQPVLDNLINRISGILKSIPNLSGPTHHSVFETGNTRKTGDTSLAGADTMVRPIKELESDIGKLYRDWAVVPGKSCLTAEGDLLKKMADSMAPIIEREFQPEYLTGMNTFSSSEEIYVKNAGLILLWPYLARFFTNLGLLRNDGFVNEAAKERAVGLLHHLGSGSGEAPEYELMLNKILCGIDPETPIWPCFTITETEIKECGNLLRSVICNWPVLKNVTLSGFQSMFLKREGIISTRDGHWVLRVTQQAHDVLLDKMPWGINTVKLPWMPELLFVEWRL